ncbi:MAG: NAD(P)-binding protein [Clostridiales bacterium]|nr:NAD(P)-binding protein [Clostridiales bacterium]
MIRISQLKLPLNHTRRMMEEKICQQLKIKNTDLISWKIVKRSVDARKKPELTFVYTVEVETEKERKIMHRIDKVGNKNIMSIKQAEYQIPAHGEEKLHHPPVIIGSGPAGLFCAWLLAKAGYQPIVLERGEMARKRKAQVDAFWDGGPLHPNSNVQFGEGGAGTFSDGKLNTSVKDPYGRNKKVLELFVEAGAPEEILYDHKPHLGTDLLITVITNLREKIEEMGGSFRFNSQVTDLQIEDGAVRKIQINHQEWLETQVVIPAIGHSARDTFTMLKDRGIAMEAKSFAVGVRIEHPQEMINLSQYGSRQVDILGAANYKLTHQLSNGRGIYSFCMCPGGYVVNASSEEGHLAVNGMSYHARDSKNANSAMIVTVSPQDYTAYAQQYLRQKNNSLAERIGENPLAGMYFQRYLEQAAYRLHDGKIPVQTFGDFLAKKASGSLGDVTPCMKGAYAPGNLREIFPEFISESLGEGITACGRKIQGFDRADAVLSGVESRTSSPVRIPRNEEFMCNIQGVYPCGEGAGYAGGITSAAMDGLRVGEAICKKYVNFL